MAYAFGEWYDYVVFAVVLAFALSIRIFHNLRPKDARSNLLTELLIGGRTMRIMPVTLPLTLTHMSGVDVLGGGARVFTDGALYMWAGVGFLVGAALVSLLLLPVIQPLNVTSLSEYVERRFSHPSTNFICSLCFFLFYLFYAVLCLYAASLVTTAITGWNRLVVVAAVGAVTTLCCVLSRAHGIVYSSLLQTALLVTWCLLVIIKGSSDLGGIEHVLNINKDADRLDFFEWDLSPYNELTTWSALFGSAAVAMALLGTHLPEIHNYKPDATFKGALCVVLVSGVWFLLGTVLVCAPGFVVFAWYQSNQTSLPDQSITQNEVVPFFILGQLAVPCVPVLFAASIVWAAFDVACSCVDKAVVVSYRYIITPLCLPPHSNTSIPRRFFALLVAALAACLSLISSFFEDNLSVMAVRFTGVSLGPLLGLLLLGVLCPCVRAHGASFGAFVGLGISLWLAFAGHSVSAGEHTVYWSANSTMTTTSPLNTTTESSVLDTFYQTSFFYVAPFGCVVTMVVALITTLFTVCCCDEDAPPADTVLRVCCVRPTEGFSKADLENIYHMTHDSHTDGRTTPQIDTIDGKLSQADNEHMTKFKLGRNWSNASKSSNFRNLGAPGAYLNQKDPMNNGSLTPTTGTPQRRGNSSKKSKAPACRHGEELDSSWVFTRSTLELRGEEEGRRPPGSSEVDAARNEVEEAPRDVLTLSPSYRAEDEETSTDQPGEFHPVSADDPEFEWMFRRDEAQDSNPAITVTNTDEQTPSNWLLKAPTRIGKTRHSFEVGRLSHADPDDDSSSAAGPMHDWKRSKSAPKARRTEGAGQLMSLFAPLDEGGDDPRSGGARSSTPPTRSIQHYQVSDSDADYAKVMPRSSRPANRPKPNHQDAESGVPPNQVDPLSFFDISVDSSPSRYRISNC